MFNYATKSDLASAAGVDKLKFAKKVDLASLKSDIGKFNIDKLEKVTTGFNSLKSKVHKLDVDKLKPVPISFGKLGNIVKNEVVKTTEYDELVKKG